MQKKFLLHPPTLLRAKKNYGWFWKFLTFESTVVLQSESSKYEENFAMNCFEGIYIKFASEENFRKIVKSFEDIFMKTFSKFWINFVEILRK